MSTLTHRLPALARTEWRLQLRHGTVATTAVVTLGWALALTVAPPAARTALGPWILLLDVAVLGWFFVPALAVLERSHGLPSALALTRASRVEPLGVRLVVTTGLALAGGLVVALVAGLPLVPVAGGITLVALLTALLALVVLGNATTMTAWMARVPVVAAPLLVPALLDGTGLWRAGVLAASPFTGALDLLAGRWSWAAAAWLATWIGVLAWLLAGRSARPPAPTRAGHAVVAERATPVEGDARTTPAERGAGPGTPVGRLPAAMPDRDHGRWRLRAVRSIVRVDRRTLLSDGLVLGLVAGIPLLALAVRWVAGSGGDWLATRHGIDVAPHVLLVWTFVLVVHAPTMLGAVAGLLSAEDRDHGVLPAVATTRAGVGHVLVTRLGVTFVVGVVGVALGSVLAGVHHPSGPAGMVGTAVVAGATAVVTGLAVAAFAADRIAAIGLVKVLALPLYLPLVTWFVDWPTVLLAPVPTSWSVRAAWATATGELAVVVVTGLAVNGLIALVLARRVVRRAGG